MAKITRLELMDLCAALYQFAGEIGAPECVLDILAAAQDGERPSEGYINEILSITVDKLNVNG